MKNYNKTKKIVNLPAVTSELKSINHKLKITSIDNWGDVVFNKNEDSRDIFSNCTRVNISDIKIENSFPIIPKQIWGLCAPYSSSIPNIWK